MVMGTLGVVYGDIGTSPLYAFRVCLSAFQLKVNEANTLGVLSLIFWSLIFQISVKYLMLVLRADLKGEGGILALTTLATRQKQSKVAHAPVILLIGLLGSGLFLGDSMLTPAVSVLSAIEGIKIVAPKFENFVLPTSIAILTAFFVIQRLGTAKISRAYGPIMVIWFLCIAVLGGFWVLQYPKILAAINPVHSFNLLTHNGFTGWQVLGGIFLVLTGGEALYADLGHFGRKPIQISWFSFVLPALLLNYFGQGAWFLYQSQSSHVTQPFFQMAPYWSLYPLIILATLVTIIASQAVVSGAFSMVYQAQRLGFLPHLNNHHYAEERIGQVYTPIVNWSLCAASILLVVGFRTSSNLVDAYGIAVSGVMLITSILIFVYVRTSLRWNIVTSIVCTGTFLFMDMMFLGANLTRILRGGWVPIFLGVGFFLTMSTWQHGRRLLRQRRREHLIDAEEFLTGISAKSPFRVPGTAVFLSKETTGIPSTLINNLEHNHVLHERIILLTLVTHEVPRVPVLERLHIEQLPLNVTRIIGHYGFMQQPNIPSLIADANRYVGDVDLDSAIYFINRDTFVLTPAKGMAMWRKRLFHFLMLSQRNPIQRFQLPTKRVIELGNQIKF